MKIAFLTSGLAAGRDGVGDYCRLLGAELARHGHQVALLAANDQLIEQPAREEAPGSFSILRLPAGEPWPERIADGRVFLEQFAPDLISLQFVAYGWHPKGLISARLADLLTLVRGWPLHVNFHEIWIGAHQRSSLKERLVGLLQRWGTISLLRKLKPRLITTSNGVYQALLQRARFAVRILPLFGNIPVEPTAASLSLRELLGGGAGLDLPPRERAWVFAFFGTIHPGWDPAPLLRQLGRLQETSALPIYILSLGQLGGGEAPWQNMVALQPPAVHFIRLGEQPPAAVSRILSNLDAGLSSMPLQLIGKSGAAAAMRDHGLPVIVSRVEPYGLGDAAERPLDPFILYADDSLPTRLQKRDLASEPAWRLPVIAREFLRMLEEGA